MFDSKSVIFDEKRSSKLYSWWVDTALADFYYKWSWKLFGRPLQDIKKICGWYWNVFRNDFDFDAHSIFSMLEYKLKRVLKALENGCAVQEPKDIKALKLAIKLAKRLKEDNYSTVAHDRVDRKYGPNHHWTTPIKGSTSVRCHSKFEKVNTPEEEKECNDYRRNQYLMSDVRMQKEEKWFYAILHKYMRTWWD